MPRKPTASPAPRSTKAPPPLPADLPTRLLGAHQSVAGGLSKAVDRAVETGCHCLQIFTRNVNRWDAAPIPPAEAEAFRAAVTAARNASASAGGIGAASQRLTLRVKIWRHRHPVSTARSTALESPPATD